MRHKSGNVFLKIFMHALVCGEDIIGVACKLETLCLYNVLPVIHAALRIVSLIGLRRPAQTQTCSQWISKKSRACGFNALRSVPVLTKMAHSNIAVPTLQYSCPLIVWCLRCCFELLASVFSAVSIHVWCLVVDGLWVHSLAFTAQWAHANASAVSPVTPDSSFGASVCLCSRLLCSEQKW